MRKCLHGGAVDGACDPLYGLWLSMRKRCRDPRARGYSNYGGRGIAVCDRWNSFAAFKADMSPRPPGTTLDRIDNDGPYSPSNCRWATPHEQTRNSTLVRRISVNGETLCVADWAARIGVVPSTISHRLRAGWGERAAVLTPRGGRQS